jgi:peroxiredoxin
VPHLKELHKKYEKDGLVIIGVHTKNGMDKYASFVRDESIPYPVCLDSEGKTVGAFRVDSFPDYYVIDRAGKLRFADLANGELDKVITALLAEKAPKAAATRK